jgi:hypothetical protein
MSGFGTKRTSRPKADIPAASLRSLLFAAPLYSRDCKSPGLLWGQLSLIKGTYRLPRLLRQRLASFQPFVMGPDFASPIAGHGRCEVRAWHLAG